MPLRCVVPALAAVVLLCAAPVAMAHPKEHHQGGAIVAPIEKIDGLTGPEVLARWFAQPYENPAPEDYGCAPFLRGTVQLIAPLEGGELSCTIPQGTDIAAFFGATCSSAEPPPFFGRTEEEQLACVREFLAGGPTVTLTVDDGDPITWTSDAYALETEQFAVDVIEGNEFEAQPGPATVVAGGWGLTVSLEPGRHALHFAAEGGEVAPPLTVTVDVVPCTKHH